MKTDKNPNPELLFYPLIFTCIFRSCYYRGNYSQKVSSSPATNRKLFAVIRSIGVSCYTVRRKESGRKEGWLASKSN